MASFIEKLRLNNLYPSLQSDNKEEDLYGRFISQVLPRAQRDRLADIEAFRPQQMQQVSPDKPMDVIFRPGIGGQLGEIAKARKIYGEEAEFPGETYRRGTLELRARELEERERASREKESLARETIGTRTQQTQERIDIAKRLAQGKMTDKDRIELQQSGELTLEEKKQGGRLALEEKEQAGRIELKEKEQAGAESLEDIKARHAKELTEFGVRVGSRSTTLPTQQRVAKIDRAETAKNTHPEWEKYITILPNKSGYVVKPPKSAFGISTGPTPEIYKAINEFIESGSNPKIESTKEPEKSVTDNKQKAIDELTKAGKPITPANIDYVMKQLGQ